MLQDPQVLGNDHNKPHSLMSDPISTMYFHNMSCDLSNKILFKPMMFVKLYFRTSDIYLISLVSLEPSGFHLRTK